MVRNLRLSSLLPAGLVIEGHRRHRTIAPDLAIGVYRSSSWIGARRPAGGQFCKAADGFGQQ